MGLSLLEPGAVRGWRPSRTSLKGLCDRAGLQGEPLTPAGELSEPAIRHLTSFAGRGWIGADHLRQFILHTADEGARRSFAGDLARHRPEIFLSSRRRIGRQGPEELRPELASLRRLFDAWSSAEAWQRAAVEQVYERVAERAAGFEPLWRGELGVILAALREDPSRYLWREALGSLGRRRPTTAAGLSRFIFN